MSYIFRYGICMADAVKDEKKSKLVSQYAYAKLKGISRQTVNEHVKRGNITLIGGKIDPELADKELAEKIDPAKITGHNAGTKEVYRYTSLPVKILYDWAGTGRVLFD